MTEQYPPEWPCKECKRPFGQHVQIGDLGEEGVGEEKAHYNWCFSRKEVNSINDLYASKFVPLDNLTYVEQLAASKIK